MCLRASRENFQPVHCAQIAASNRVAETDMPELLPSRWRGRLFDANPEERERAAACRRLARASAWHEIPCAYGFHAPKLLEPIEPTCIRFPSTSCNLTDEAWCRA